MSKAVLVMDMPSNCNECPCRYLTEGCYSDICQVTYDELPERYDTAKPDWCPLKPMPEKKEVLNVDAYLFGKIGLAFDSGYNACIKELTNGSSQEESDETNKETNQST